MMRIGQLLCPLRCYWGGGRVRKFEVANLQHS